MEDVSKRNSSFFSLTQHGTGTHEQVLERSCREQEHDTIIERGHGIKNTTSESHRKRYDKKHITRIGCSVCKYKHCKRAMSDGKYN